MTKRDEKQARHTPAPWTAEVNGGDDDDERRLLICSPAGTFDGRSAMIAQAERVIDAGDPEANAQLMAAAPDLLAELQSCEQLLGLLLAGNMPPDRNDSRWAEVGECKIRAAALIRKARGE